MEVRKLSYENYLEEDEFYRSENLSLQKILNGLNNKNFTISSIEFFSIIHWVEDVVADEYKDLDYNEQLKVCSETLFRFGLELFGEIPFKTDVRMFLDILCFFEDETNTSLYSRTNVTNFKQFLEFLLSYTAELTLFVNDNYHYDLDTKEQNYEMQGIIESVKMRSGQHFYNLAVSRIRENIEYYMDTSARTKEQEDENSDRVESQRNSTLTDEEWNLMQCQQDLLYEAGFIHLAKSLYKGIENYSGDIFMLHSY